MKCGWRFANRGICSLSGYQRSRQFFRSVHFGSDTIRQPHCKLNFQACQQLHSLQAAQSKIAIELRRRPKHRQGTFAAQFGEQRAQNIENAFARGRAVELCAGCRHETPIEVLSERLSRATANIYAREKKYD